jgi:hypothetical protein
MKRQRKILTLFASMLLVIASMLMTVQADTVDVDVKEARNGVLQLNLVYEQDGTQVVLGGGTTFLINDDTIVTTYDVVHLEDQSSNYERALDLFGSGFDLKKVTIQVVVKNDLTLEAKLVNESKTANFAILELEQPIYNRTSLKLNSNTDLSETQQVYALGFPDAVTNFQNANSYTYDDVTISDGRVTKTTESNGIKYVNHSATLSAGTSGGPLLAEDGSVVALNAYSGTYSYSVDIREVTDALGALGIDYTSADDSTSATTEAAKDEDTTVGDADDDSAVDTDDEDDKEASAQIVEKPTVDSSDDADDEEDAEEGPNMILIIAIIGVVVVVIIIIIILVVALGGNKKKSNTGGNGGMMPPTNMTGGNGGMNSNMMQGRPPVPPTQGRPMPPAQNNNYFDDGAGATTVLNEGAGETTVLGGQPTMVAAKSILRVKTRENIAITRPEFAIGKERRRVDYCVADNNSISRVHAKLVVRGSELYLMDMNATNGTFVNGTKLSPGQEVRLSAGDRFKLADEEFQVQ